MPRPAEYRSGGDAVNFKTDAKELIPRILSFGGVAIVPEYLTRDVPGILTKPYNDGIAIHVKLAYKGSLQPRIKKLLSAFQKRTYNGSASF